MEYISVSSSSLDSYGSLSPELWIATSLAAKVAEGTPLSEIVTIVTETSKPIEADALVLDTGSANNGLLNIQIHDTGNKKRTSSKKIFHEGDILISRLRPYLRQVVYIPPGTFQLLNVSKGYCSTEFYVLRPQQDKSIAYLVNWLLSCDVQEMIGGAATGGHHPRFDKSLLINSNVPLTYQSSQLSEEVSQTTLNYLQSQIDMKTLLKC